MHAIRKLAREIHRRSVWQVAGGYLLAGWLVYEGVVIATQRLGLPEWTPTLTLVLVVLGAPMVMATTMVQGGIPWLRIEDVMDPNELEGLTPDQVHVIPSAHPMYGEGVFTWRNAILSGVAGLALLVTSVTAYLTMWALGIGPVGSLVAQGVLEPGAPIMVVPFENRTDDQRLGMAVTDAFLADLGESELVRIAGFEQLGPARAAVGLPPGPLGLSAARAVAEEAEIPVIIHGEVARLGQGFRVEVRIVVPGVTSPVARFEEVAASPGEMIPMIDLLSERVRAKLGESLRAIRADLPLEQLVGEDLTQDD